MGFSMGLCGCERLFSLFPGVLEAVGGGESLPELVSRHKLRLLACRCMGDELDGGWVREALEEQGRRRAAALDVLRELAARCAQAGAEFAVLKGLSFEPCIYGEEELRDVGDVDVLVRPGDVQAVHAALVSMGYGQRTGRSSSGGASGRALAALLASTESALGLADPRVPVRKAPDRHELSP